MVTDRERGSMADVSPVAWQTDTSVGDWFYNKNRPFRKADWIVHTLVDVVSKNGNLLLNVVQRPDGSLDQDLVETLHQVGEWMKTNGESIYGTRPWITFGEGPTKVGGGHFNEDFPFSGKDIRFAVKGKNTLFATILGAPKTNDLTIQLLAQFEGVTGKVTKVVSLQGKQNLQFTQDKTGLHITLPTNIGNGFAYAFKITCSDVSGFRPDLVPKPEPTKVMADKEGNFDLSPDLAETTGGMKSETKDGQLNFGYWDSPKASASWFIKLEKPGTFEISTEGGTENAGSTVTCKFIHQSEKVIVAVMFAIPHTAKWNTFVKLDAQRITLSAGTYEVTISSAFPEKWSAVNLRGLKMKRVD